MDNNSNFALITALNQAGLKLKVAVFPTGYQPDIIHTPAWQAVRRVYFLSEFRPTAIPNAGTVQMANALEKYQHRSPANFPTFNIYESWLGADPHDQGHPVGGQEPHVGQRHQGTAQREVVQRQRTATCTHQLRDRFRKGCIDGLRLVHAGPEERLRCGQHPADVREDHRRHDLPEPLNDEVAT